MAVVSRALKEVPGVIDVAVDLAAGRATVTHRGASHGALRQAVEDAGYNVVS